MKMGVWTEDDKFGRGEVGDSGIDNIGKDRVEEHSNGRLVFYVLFSKKY